MTLVGLYLGHSNGTLYFLFHFILEIQVKKCVVVFLKVTFILRYDDVASCCWGSTVAQKTCRKACFCFERGLSRMFLSCQELRDEAESFVRSFRDTVGSSKQLRRFVWHADMQKRFALNSFRFYLRVIDVVESSAAVQQLRVFVPSSGGVAVTHSHWVTCTYVHIGCVSGEITVSCTILSARSYFSVKERCSGCGELHMSR